MTKSSVDVSKVERCDKDGVAAQVFRLCLQAPWNPAALESAREVAARGDVSWDVLRNPAYFRGMAPLFYAIVRGRGLLPPPVERELRLAYFRNARRNVRLFHALEGVLRRLAAADVPVVLLKGAALAEAVYENPAVRPVGDFDLLVRREDAPEALDVLGTLGYERLGVEAHAGDALTYENEVALVGTGAAACLLEVHWSLFDAPFYQHRMPMEWFWASASPIHIGPVDTLMLGPEAQVLHLCGHLALHHGSGGDFSPLWLYDVAAVIACYGERLDWDAVLERAQVYDLVLPLQRVLPRVRDMWRAPFPTGLLERLRALCPSGAEVRVFDQLTAARRPVVRRFWADLAGLPDWRARVRYAWSNLFPSPRYMRHRYAIPHPFLLPLYYPYRWWLGLYGLLTARRTRR